MADKLTPALVIALPQAYGDNAQYDRFIVAVDSVQNLAKAAAVLAQVENLTGQASVGASVLTVVTGGATPAVGTKVVPAGAYVAPAA